MNAPRKLCSQGEKQKANLMMMIKRVAHLRKHLSIQADCGNTTLTLYNFGAMCVNYLVYVNELIKVIND